MNSFQHFTPQASADPPTQPLKRTRAKRSCDFCRKRKSRCDADNSIPCTNCKAWGYTCEFQTVRKKRGPPSVYVDNLEKKCRKMESLLSAITKLSIKDLERNDFQYAGHIRLDSPSFSDSSSGDEDEEDEQQQQQQQQQQYDEIENYDSIKYTGQSSIGLDFIDDDFFKSQSTIPWPGRQDVVLQPMSQDELMIVSTEKSATTGKFDKRVDVGLSMHGPLFNIPPRSPNQKTTTKKPARHHLDKMIGLYFTHIHSALPIVNKTRFLAQYHSNQANPPTILTHAVLAFSFRFASQHLPDLVTHADEYGDFYFRKVMKRLRDISRSRLCHVQAAILMSLYLDNDEDDVESIQWCTLGSAIRMAQDLGLHRSCAKWNLPRSEIETRHRVFYACYILDRWLGARAGKPLTILDRDFDTDMPSPYEVTDDENETPSQPIYRSFLLAIKLSEILGRVLKALYAPKAKIANSNANLDDPTILAVFDRRLKNWKTSLDEPLDGYYLSDIEKANLQLYYYTLVLLLNRPFNRASFAKFPNLQSIAEESQQACRHAATRISSIVQQRRKETSDPAYHAAFCAPSFFIYALFQSALVHLSNALRNRNATTKQALYQSINLIKMHWDINPAPRAVEILNMLASINGLSSSDEVTSTEEAGEVRSEGTIPSPPIPSQYDARVEQEMPKTHCLQRMINTSIIGGITPDIQQDITSWSIPTYPVYSQSPSSSSPPDHQLPQLPHHQHHPHPHHQQQQQQQHEFSTPPLHHPPPLLTTSYSTSNANFAMAVPMVNYEPVYDTHLPQVPPAFTAYHSNVVRSLPPSSLNWSDWDVYIGHQAPRP